MLRQDPKLQIENITQYVRSRPDMALVGEFVDQISGTRDKRPALDELLAQIRRRQVDVVIVAALDRLGRNASHLLQLADVFREHNVGLVSLREAIDLSTPSGRAFFQILSAIAELDRSQVAERIRCALAARKLIAERTGSGWRCGRPNVATPEVVEEVLALRKQGMSIRKIERTMGRRVSRTSISRILAENGLTTERQTTVLKKGGSRS